MNIPNVEETKSLNETNEQLRDSNLSICIDGHHKEPNGAMVEISTKIDLSAADELSNRTVEWDTSFGIYELLLMIFTQSGYLPVAAALLSTTFFEPSKAFCRELLALNSNLTSFPIDPEYTHEYVLSQTDEFYSLNFEWREVCRQSYSVVKMTTAIMFGGIVGSFIAGFMADRYGRKPTVVGCLLILAASNLALLPFAADSPNFVLTLFFVMGCSCGGYMVTNVVFVLEAVQTEKTRLLVASLNGWPIGMVFTAFAGYVCREWHLYYGLVAVTALCVAALLYSQSFESVGWLDNRNKQLKAAHVRNKIGQRNRRQWIPKSSSLPASPPLLPDELKRKSNSTSDVEKDDKTKKLPIQLDGHFLTVTNGIQKSTYIDDSKSTNVLIPQSKAQSRSKTQTYADLFRHSEVRRPLLALLYCFMTSSVVSFGFYFTTEVMPGSRYVNLASMGGLKFTLGLLPYAISYFCSKKLIILGSVGAASLACWTLAIGGLWFGMLESAIATVLGVAVTATMDPTWKISHLYSVELFPVNVRNMARGVCNVTARLGSMAGPLIILLRSYNPVIPFWLFACLLTAQWIILAAFLPTVGVDSLHQEMPKKQNVNKTRK
ncbi:Major facilitator superfamily MFS-1 domain containing protein [Aphelenchoides besseyi]|nr:Major facilitator superfamily MFS-1 domain containing protein [Aphelenchoides besseyi]